MQVEAGAYACVCLVPSSSAASYPFSFPRFVHLDELEAGLRDLSSDIPETTFAAFAELLPVRAFSGQLQHADIQTGKYMSLLFKYSRPSVA